MALELQIAKGALDSTAGTLIISDSTGDYDASSNTTGFGSPNPARADVALFLRAYNNRYEGASDITGTLMTVTADDSDPAALTKWTATLIKDGWIKATVYGVLIYDTATSFELNEIVWNDSLNKLEKILTKSGSGPYTYTKEDATEADLEDSDNYIRYSTVLNTYAIPDLCECYLKSINTYLQSQEADDKALADKIRAYEVSLKNSFLTGSPAEGQKKVERAEAICACFTDNCNC